MRHENPLGYLLALEGVALLRAFSGDHDRAFTERRIAEVRRLLDTYGGAEVGRDVLVLDPESGYREWAATYDRADNPAFGDETTVAALLEALRTGEVLDAGCGTGRLSRWLADRGHRVTGVDVSQAMLDVAATAVPEGSFRRGELGDLPLPDESVDAAVCTLALAHLEDLARPLSELARVVRPGGRIVVSDVHPESMAFGSAPAVRTDAGGPARIATFRHRVGDYVRAGLAAGLTVRDLVELEPPPPDPGRSAAEDLGPWHAWPWSLRDVVPEAAHSAGAGVPALLVLALDKP